MQTLPHHYDVQAKAQADSNLQVHVANLTDLTVAPPSVPALAAPLAAPTGAPLVPSLAPLSLTGVDAPP